MAVDASRVKSLFLAASDLADRAERAAFLERECGGDDELRDRVEALLRANDAAPLPPAGALAATSTHAGDRKRPTEDSGDPTACVGAIIAGRYKLLEAIGEGGMGSVWVAEQTQPVRRKVALKLIKAGMDSKSVLARFEAERQALAVMDHPNIAKVLDGGLTDAGRPFFVMEYIKGVPITEYCDATRLSVPERLNLFVQVCQAVQHAHQKGIIHRDLKPSNILVAPYDDRPVPKVIDFGLAKAMHQSLTERTLHTAHETVLGTPLYMSPEQAQLNNLDVDTRSDIYSLGVLLYELLTGTTPIERLRFREAAWDEVRRIIREEEPPRPSTRLSSSNTLPSLAAGRQIEPARLTKLVRGELDWIVMKSLEKDRARRYETANGFAMDIQRYLAGEPVLAAPPSAGYRMRKFARKHRTGLATATVIALLLLAGVAVSSWQAVRATNAEAAARAAEQEARQAQRAEAERAEGERLAKTEAQQERDDKDKALRAEAEQRKLAVAASAEATMQRKETIESINKLALVYLESGAYSSAETLLDRVREAQVELNGAMHLKTLATVQNLATAQWKNGKTKFAIDLLEGLKQYRTELQGVDHPDTLATLSQLAQLYRDTGRIREALTIYTEVHQAKLKVLGSNHPATLASQSNLATVYFQTGQVAQAMALLESTRDTLEKVLGSEHPHTVAANNNLASVYTAVGKSDRAIALYESVRDTRVKQLGAYHPDTILAEQNLAFAYKSSGKLVQATAILERIRDLQFKNFIAQDASMLTTTNNLAVAYQAAGKLGEAIRLFEQVREAQEKKQGVDHPDTLAALNNLALAHQDAGKLDLALPLLEETLQLRKAKLGPDHPDTLQSMNNLGKSYSDANQGEKAVATFKEFVAGQRKRAKPDDPQFAGLVAQVALDLLKCRQHAAAREMLRECLAIREKNEPDVWTTFNTKSLLGGALLGQKKYADAEPLLLAGYEGMKQRQDKIPANGKIRIPEALDRLIELYTATNKPDEAKKWQAERAEHPAVAPKALEKR